MYCFSTLPNEDHFQTILSTMIKAKPCDVIEYQALILDYFSYYILMYVCLKRHDTSYDLPMRH